MTAAAALSVALAAFVEAGGIPSCADGSGRWLSEDRAEREAAAVECGVCPLLAPCGAAADATRDRFGVWGGRDRTPVPRRVGGGS